MRATCTCTSVVALRHGSAVCASCGAAIISDVLSGSDDEVSSVRLPVDARSVDAFNRACRTGRVRGAVKRGRIWTCSRTAWNARSAAETPPGLPSRKRKPMTTEGGLSDDLLSELGLSPRRRAS